MYAEREDTGCAAIDFAASVSEQQDVFAVHPLVQQVEPIPAAFAWLLTTTVAHARAKEDHLRRIDEIERSVNQLAREELLVFQSRHPNRRKAAGRSGQGTILALLTACEAMLWGCACLFQSLGRPESVEVAYLGYIACIATYLFAPVLSLRRYAYRKPPPASAPVFVRRTPLAEKNGQSLDPAPI